MKVKGTHLKEAESLPIPIFRGEEVEYLLAGPVDLEIFDETCPPPKPVLVQRPGGEAEPDFKNPKYVEQLDVYAKKRIGYMIFKSLQATDGIEWEMFEDGKSETYLLWREELAGYGLTNFEINRVLSAVMEANSLTEDRVVEARKSFLAHRRQAKA